MNNDTLDKLMKSCKASSKLKLLMDLQEFIEEQRKKLDEWDSKHDTWIGIQRNNLNKCTKRDLLRGMEME